MSQLPTHCCYCQAFDPSGETLAHFALDVELAMTPGRRQFEVSFCRGKKICRDEAMKYVAAICDGDVEERFTSQPPRGAPQDVDDHQQS